MYLKFEMLLKVLIIAYKVLIQVQLWFDAIELE